MKNISKNNKKKYHLKIMKYGKSNLMKIMIKMLLNPKKNLMVKINFLMKIKK